MLSSIHALIAIIAFTSTGVLASAALMSCVNSASRFVSGQHSFLRYSLMSCTAGFSAMLGLCSVLSAHFWASPSMECVTTSLFASHWRPLATFTYTCGASFVFSAAAAVFVEARAAVAEEASRLDTVRMSAATVLKNQLAAEQRTDLLNVHIAERRKAEITLEQVTQHDTLTGLANRAYLIEMLRKTFSLSSKRRSESTFLMYIDLDRFRSVNNMLGNRAGDTLLKTVAARLRECVREDDIVVRLSGDEFAILFRHINAADKARRTAERILAAIEVPVDSFEIYFPITASIGICEICERYCGAEDVVRDADTAMYHAKLLGGNRYVFYDSAMYDESLKRIQTTLQLRSALDNKEFELFYQPLVDMRSRSVYGVESLIRWNHPKRGLLSAAEFVQHLDDAGYSVPVGLWVLRQACTDLKAIRSAAGRDIVMSINVSNRQLEDQSFMHELNATIKCCQVDPHMLQLEILESSFMRDAERIGHVFETIRVMGVRIALDDFGTGYSALSYLQRFPVDTLKIDQSFVRGMQENSLDTCIVTFLMSLAASAKMNVVAEGVEDEEHAEALLGCGCSHAQGYLYSRPVPLGSLIALLESGLPLPVVLHGSVSI